jgi:hypothetical protein
MGRKATPVSWFVELSACSTYEGCADHLTDISAAFKKFMKTFALKSNECLLLNFLLNLQIFYAVFMRNTIFKKVITTISKSAEFFLQ